MKKDLLSINDLSVEDINSLFHLSFELKKRRKAKRKEDFLPLRGKTLAMIFQKASTRTRVSFEVGIFELGGMAIYLNANDMQMGRGESLADTARILSRYVDGILIRTYRQEDVEELAGFASIPVINGLTDKLHPCQILSDMFTIQEKKGRLENLKIAYIGDGNNVANSWLHAAAKMNLQLWVATPAGYEPEQEIIDEVITPEVRKKNQIVICHDPEEAACGADVLYTDVWISMGQEEESEKKRQVFSGYQINEVLVGKAQEDVLVMHCLPAHPGEEITSGVLDGEKSIIFDQAENRLYVQQSILIRLLEDR